MVMAWNRGQWQSFIRASISAGLGGGQAYNVALTSAKDLGLHVYRKTDFLADYRSWANVETLRNPLQAVRLDYKPSKNLFSEAQRVLTRRFKYDVDVKAIDMKTGRTFTMPTSVSSMDWLTPNQMRTEAIDAIKESQESIEIIGALQTAVFHQPGETWD